MSENEIIVGVTHLSKISTGIVQNIWWSTYSAEHMLRDYLRKKVANSESVKLAVGNNPYTKDPDVYFNTKYKYLLSEITSKSELAVTFYMLDANFCVDNAQLKSKKKVKVLSKLALNNRQMALIEQTFDKNAYIEKIQALDDMENIVEIGLDEELVVNLRGLKRNMRLSIVTLLPFDQEANTTTLLMS